MNKNETKMKWQFTKCIWCPQVRWIGINNDWRKISWKNNAIAELLPMGITTSILAITMKTRGQRSRQSRKNYQPLWEASSSMWIGIQILGGCVEQHHSPMEKIPQGFNTLWFQYTIPCPFSVFKSHSCAWLPKRILHNSD